MWSKNMIIEHCSYVEKYSYRNGGIMRKMEKTFQKITRCFHQQKLILNARIVKRSSSGG